MKEDKMTEQSTPTQESAPEKAPNLDAVLEGAINQVMDNSEAPPPAEEKEKPLPDTPQEKVEETNSEESNSDSLDQVAPENEEETKDSTEEPSDEIDDAAVAHVQGEDSKEPPLQAPKNWSEEVRSKFTELPREAQEYMLKRDKEMTADYTRKTQEIAEQRKNFESFDKVIAPMRQQIAASGISEPEYIARLLNADLALRNNPKMALKQLAQGYGIDLSSYDSDSVELETDSQISQLQQQNQAILAELNQFKQQNLQSARQQTENQINTFSQTKDDKGNLKYPHFDKVRVKMGNLIDAGEAKGLEDAYAKAVRLDDELYKESLDAQRKSAKAEEDARRKAAVEKAKKVRPRTATAPPSGSVKASDLDTLLMDSISKAGVVK
jgi:hypothetical protein|tara:strand:- start:379 stop:1521 length:1143 start_codon:yes stop_codon:yes gene_type:complete